MSACVRAWTGEDGASLRPSVRLKNSTGRSDGPSTYAWRRRRRRPKPVRSLSLSVGVLSEPIIGELV